MMNGYWFFQSLRFVKAAKPSDGLLVIDYELCIMHYELVMFCDEFFHPYHVEPLVELAAAFVEMGYLGVAVLGMETDGGLSFCRDAGTEIDDTLSSKTFFQFCIEGGADAATVGILVDID